MPDALGGNELAVDIYGGNQMAVEAVGRNELAADAVADCIGAYVATLVTDQGGAIVTDTGTRLTLLIMDRCGG